MLDIDQVVVVVNKMDGVGFDQARFIAVERDIRDYLAELGMAPSEVVPVSARDGDNIAARSDGCGSARFSRCAGGARVPAVAHVGARRIPF